MFTQTVPATVNFQVAAIQVNHQPVEAIPTEVLFILPFHAGNAALLRFGRQVMYLPRGRVQQVWKPPKHHPSLPKCSFHGYLVKNTTTTQAPQNSQNPTNSSTTVRFTSFISRFGVLLFFSVIFFHFFEFWEPFFQLNPQQSQC